MRSRHPDEAETRRVVACALVRRSRCRGRRSQPAGSSRRRTRRPKPLGAAVLARRSRATLRRRAGARSAATACSDRGRRSAAPRRPRRSPQRGRSRPAAARRTGGSRAPSNPSTVARFLSSRSAEASIASASSRRAATSSGDPSAACSLSSRSSAPSAASSWSAPSWRSRPSRVKRRCPSLSGDALVFPGRRLHVRAHRRFVPAD